MHAGVVVHFGHRFDSALAYLIVDDAWSLSTLEPWRVSWVSTDDDADVDDLVLDLGEMRKSALCEAADLAPRGDMRCGV